MSLTPDPAITGLSDEERELLIEALCALRYVRGREWRAACSLADERGKRRPGLARMQERITNRGQPGHDRAVRQRSG